MIADFINKAKLKRVLSDEIGKVTLADHQDLVSFNFGLFTATEMFSNLEHFSFFSQIKCWLSGLVAIKCLSKQQKGTTLSRLLLQKQSDLGLHCLSRPLWQAPSVRYFRIFTENTNLFTSVIIDSNALVKSIQNSIEYCKKSGSRLHFSSILMNRLKKMSLRFSKFVGSVFL